jgi:hypothetical protein
MLNTRTTICLSSSRSWAKLAQAIQFVNKCSDREEEFAGEDRIDFNPIMSKTGDLERFEITASSFDLFQIGLRYGQLDENEKIQK